jgi:hypothetical protein
VEEIAMETVIWVLVVVYVAWRLRQVLDRASR